MALFFFTFSHLKSNKGQNDAWWFNFIYIHIFPIFSVTYIGSALLQSSDQSDNDSSDNDDDDDVTLDDKSGLELSTEQRKELSTASDDELNEINDQRYTGNVKSQNRKQRKQITVKTADRPDEYDYDSSDEEVCVNLYSTIIWQIRFTFAMFAYF